MKKHGKIIRFKKSTGYGTISYRISSNLKAHILFHTTGIVRFQRQDIKLGQVVVFDIFEANSEKLAVNIVLIRDGRAKTKTAEENLHEIIAYYNEHWEEVEKIIEEEYQSDKISADSSEVLKSNIRNEKLDSNLVALGLFGNKIKLVSLTKDGEYSFLDEGKKHHNILYPSFIEEASLELAIEEFEDLLNSTKATENDFQKFFDRNQNFILNDEYKRAHPHIILAKENKRKLIPDFVLEPVNQSEFCDLLELKLPSAQIYVMKKNREHFSAAITEAAAQLRTYAKFFNEEKNRNSFQKSYPLLKIYKPRMFLIIGRQTDENPLIKREIQAENPQLILKNFDDLLARMKWKKENLANKNKLFR